MRKFENEVSYSVRRCGLLLSIVAICRHVSSVILNLRVLMVASSGE